MLDFLSAGIGLQGSAMSLVPGAGGKIVIACWCQREETAERPLTPSDKSKLQFLYDEWAHPFFVSYQQFARLLQVRGHSQFACSVPEPTRLSQWIICALNGLLPPAPPRGGPFI